MAKVKCEPGFTQLPKLNILEARKLTVDGAEVGVINPEHFTTPAQATFDTVNSFSMTGNHTEEFQIGRQVQLDSGQSSVNCNVSPEDLTPDDIFTVNKYDYSIITDIQYDGVITDVTISDSILTSDLEEASVSINWIDSQAGLITTTDLINSTQGYPSDFVLETSGFTAPGDGGGGQWVQNGVIAQTPSQSPAQTGESLLNDASGNQWNLVEAKIESFGVKHDGGDYTNEFEASLNRYRDDGARPDFKGQFEIDASTTTVSVNADMSFNNLDIKFNNPDSSSTTYFNLKTDGQLNIHSCKYNGGTTESGGVKNQTSHFISTPSTGFQENIIIENNDISFMSLPILKTNTQTSQQQRFHVKFNNFHDNFGIDCLFNSPASGGYMKDIAVIGNTFGDNHGALVGANAHRISCAGHVEGYRVIGNHAYGAGDEFWRAEEGSTIGVVIGNTAQIGESHGIEITGNDAGGTPRTNNHLVVASNVMEGQGVAGTRGLHFVFDGNNIDPIYNSVVTGNITKNFETGLRTSRGSGTNHFNNNIFTESDQGIEAQEPTILIDNNIIVDCDVGINSGNGGIYGRMHFRSSANGPYFVPTPATGDLTCINGWTWETDIFELAIGTNQLIDIMPIGDVFYGRFTVMIYRSQTAYDVTVFDADWDGATLTFDVKFSKSIGAVTIDPTPMQDNAGNLALVVDNGTGSIQAGTRLQVVFDGSHVFNA